MRRALSSDVSLSLPAIGLRNAVPGRFALLLPSKRREASTFTYFFMYLLDCGLTFVTPKGIGSGAPWLNTGAKIARKSFATGPSSITRILFVVWHPNGTISNNLG